MFIVKVMNLLGYNFLLLLTLWSLGWTTVTMAVSRSVQEVLSFKCDIPIQHTVTATSEIQTTVVKMEPTSRSTTNSSYGMDSETECNVWHVKSEDGQSEIIAIINSLNLAFHDFFFIFSESDHKAVSYDYNVTQQNMDLFPKNMRSTEPFTFIWVHYPALYEVNVSTKPRLAFSYWIRETNVSLAEKEKVVMMGAIVVSIFTVIATLISITRATKCHCIRNTWTFLKARERDRYTAANAHSFTASGEIVSLMLANTPSVQYPSRCLSYQVSEEHRGDVYVTTSEQETSENVTARPLIEPVDPGALSDDVTARPLVAPADRGTLSNDVTARPLVAPVDRGTLSDDVTARPLVAPVDRGTLSDDVTARPLIEPADTGALSDDTSAEYLSTFEREQHLDQSLVPVSHDLTTPGQSMSTLIGLLPRVSAPSIVTSHPPTQTPSSSFRFFISLLPSRLRHGAQSGSHVFLTSQPPSTMASREHAPGEQNSSSRPAWTSFTPRHFSPFQHLHSSSNFMVHEETGLRDSSSREVQYNDIPPPPYSVLFPNNM